MSQSLLDGCAVGFSARSRAGRHHVRRFRADRCASPTRWSGCARWRASSPGAAPGHGGFFDWDPSDRAPSLELHDNVFRADQRPSFGSLGLPAGADVTLLRQRDRLARPALVPRRGSWLAKCPDTRIVTSATRVDRRGDALEGRSDRRDRRPRDHHHDDGATTTTTTHRRRRRPRRDATGHDDDDAPTTTTTTAPPVGTGSGTCLGTGAKVVAGAQTARYKPDLTSATAVDARTASWPQVDDWPVSITGTGPLCWHGGTITGTYPDTTLWETFHSTGAFNVANPDSIVENVRIHDYGDGIRLREGASHWTVRGADESYLHDDCVENDRLYTGTVTDSLLDGCYVAFSTRPSSSDTTSDGRGHTMTVDHSLVRLQPMPTDLQGPGARARRVLQVGRHRPLTGARRSTTTCSASTSSRTTDRSACPTATRCRARAT